MINVVVLSLVFMYLLGNLYKLSCLHMLKFLDRSVADYDMISFFLRLLLNLLENFELNPLIFLVLLIVHG